MALAGCALDGADASEGPAAPSLQTSSARVSAAVDAELGYVHAHWKSYNPDYQPVAANDCVNFASQALVARGWEQTDEWNYGGSIDASTASWRSSTAMADWLSLHPELAAPLDDSQRAQVKVGDIVQFDWDDSGDRDHTGIVTRVTHSASGTQVFFAGHTDDSIYRSVDQAIHIDHPGARVYYWSLAG